LENVSYFVGPLLIKMERVSKRAIRISSNRPQEITIVVVFYLRVSDTAIASHEEPMNGKSLSDIYLLRIISDRNTRQWIWWLWFF